MQFPNANNLNHLIKKSPWLSTICLTILLLVSAVPDSATAQVIEAEVKKDELKVDSSLPWGIKKWSYGKVIEVRDLGDSIYGRVVIDRYGKDESGGVVKEPFSRNKPGKFIFVSMWGSNLDGCQVETVVQIAPKSSIDPRLTLPTLIEFVVNGERFQLPHKASNPKIISYKYNYLDGNNGEQQALWHMNHRIFPISSLQAEKLRAAPIEDIDARMHFGDSKSIPFTIGVDTVERWQDIYSFNSGCEYIE